MLRRIADSARRRLRDKPRSSRRYGISVAGLELLLADTQSVDVRPAAGAAIDDAISAVVRSNHAMIPCGAHVGQTHVRRRGASDFQLGGAEGRNVRRAVGPRQR